VDTGAALVVANGDLNGARLGGMLRQLCEDPERLRKMGERASALAKPDAAETIVKLCYEMVNHG